MHVVQLFRLRSFGLFSVLLTAGLLCAVGCKGSGGPDGSIAVTGSVSSEGSAVTTGTVHFVGKDSGASGSAAIGAEGQFEVHLKPGTYQVTVIAKDGVDTMDEDGNPVVAKSLVPEKYASIETSDLEVQISDSNNTVALDLSP